MFYTGMEKIYVTEVLRIGSLWKNLKQPLERLHNSMADKMYPLIILIEWPTTLKRPTNQKAIKGKVMQMKKKTVNWSLLNCILS